MFNDVAVLRGPRTIEDAPDDQPGKVEGEKAQAFEERQYRQKVFFS
jgi:hypothetical protein